jgi:nucleoside-diphosphate-sugar epimerase
MKFFITGHDGFIGSHLCPYLESQGHELIKLEGDIRDFRFYYQKPDMIIHMAAMTSVPKSLNDPELYYDVNVNGARNLFNWAESWRIPIINFSSSNAVAWWVNPYAVTKKIAEEIVPKQSVTIRPYNVWPGRDDMLIAKLKRGDVKVINGTHYRDWIHIDDFCEGILKVAENYYELEGQTIDFGSGTSVSVLEFAKSMGWEGEINYGPTPTEREVTKADSTIIEKLLGRKLKNPNNNGLQD